MIASNTAEISNTGGFLSSIIPQCESSYINDPDNGLSCCFEDNLNKGIFKSIIGKMVFNYQLVLLSLKKLLQTKPIYVCAALSVWEFFAD